MAGRDLGDYLGPVRADMPSFDIPRVDGTDDHPREGVVEVDDRAGKDRRVLSPSDGARPPLAFPDPALVDWPDFGLHADIRPALAAAMAAGEPAVLATLHAARGGAPYGLGAQMLFSRTALAGYLSGGCIEADVALHAAEALADGNPRRLVYGDGGPIDIRLPCGSRIEVLVERLAASDASAKALIDLSADRRPAVWITDGRSRACVEPGRVATTARALASRADVEGLADRLVHRRYVPASRLVIVGGEPVALALARLAAETGFETILIRPSGPEKAPSGVSRYIRTSVAQAMAETPPDPWTAIAVVTHDGDQQEEALIAALATPAFYIGALGSRRRIPERNDRLLSAGLRQADLARVHAPIGLPTGSKTAWGIAVSIIAEINASSLSPIASAADRG